MGFFTNLFRKKTNTLLLEEGKVEEKEIHKDKVDIHIYSKKMGNDMEYTIKMFSDGEEINVGTMRSNMDNPVMELRSVAKDIQNVVEPLVGNETNYPLSRVKQATENNLKRVAGNNQITLSGDVINYITDYKLVDYSKVDALPRKVDVSKLSDNQIMQIGQKLQTRLNRLDKIETPEDAYEDRENLISYMQDKEKSPLNPIIEANLQSKEDGITLDEDTILKIAQNMEGINNEDGALYSVYLKIEEKRIWRQLQEKIAQYSNDSEDKDKVNGVYELSALLENLEGYELKRIDGGLSTEVLSYIISQMKEMDIVTYSQKYKNSDALLAKTIISEYSDIPDKQQILQFLYSRMGSLGQLSHKSSKNIKSTLRNFIINTDFKHEDNTETKEFLLLVSQIEKNYIRNEYEEIIDIYKEKQASKSTFKDRLNVADSLTPMTSIVIHNQEKSLELEDDKVEQL